MLRYFSLLIIICTAWAGASAQQFKASGFSISNSPLLNEIRSIRAANPKMTTSDLVAGANAALEKQGFTFVFTFDAATCAKLEKAYAEQKPGQPPLKLSATLSSVDGEKAPIVIPEHGLVKGNDWPWTKG